MAIGYAIAIGVALAVTTYAINISKHHQKFKIGDVMGSATFAAFTSAATFGIGEYFASGAISNFYLNATIQAVAHGTLQGAMSSAQGGKFWSGFASGAISSIVSSAWSGDTNHQGVSGALGFKGNKGITLGGTLFFGTISGGAGAALTGGNFWQGAVTGLVVSGLNHVLHGSPNPKTGLKSRRYTTNDKGEIISESLNYFNPDSPYDVNLYNRAESESLKMNELTVYSHGSMGGFAGANDFNKNNVLSNILYQDSKMWRNLVDGNTKNLTMVLKACNTGKLDHKINISNVLTKQFSGLTIFSASDNWGADGRVQYHKNNKLLYGDYSKYQNGEYQYSVPNK